MSFKEALGSLYNAKDQNRGRRWKSATVCVGPWSKGKSPSTQLLQDLQVANDHNVVLAKEIAKLKLEMSASHDENVKLKEQMIHQQSVHNNHIDKLLQ
ncbi:hypothetical protein HAX54_024564 [Datura stramonium]|uniref:Uncharacterized protein n=1 Tax=Datura stramonium TaxID=4076 RepID=A0ABS8UYA9_DATST|nr:hypothetical protein [Datura stramonium]